MKKIMILIMILLISGCNLNKDFKTICIKEEKSPYFNEIRTFNIYFNSSDEITKIEENYRYELIDKNKKDSILYAKKALSNYTNSRNYTSIINEENENIYDVTYILDVKNLKDDQLKNINITRYYYDQIKVYKNNMKCN